MQSPLPFKTYLLSAQYNPRIMGLELLEAIKKPKSRGRDRCSPAYGKILSLSLINMRSHKLRRPSPLPRLALGHAQPSLTVCYMQIVDSNMVNVYIHPSSRTPQVQSFNPNTSGNISQAFLLTSTCPRSHPSTQLSQNPWKLPPKTSLTERICNIFVPDREESVIRPITFRCASDTLGEGQLSDEHG